MYFIFSQKMSSIGVVKFIQSFSELEYIQNSLLEVMGGGIWGGG